MPDRSPPRTFEQWTQWVEQQIAALQRGDNFTGVVSVGRLQIGNILVDDGRILFKDLSGPVPTEIVFTDKSTGTQCILPLPCIDDDGPGPSGPPLPPFDFPGPLLISVSDLWCPVQGTVNISRFVCSLVVVSTTVPVVAGVYKNGAQIGTITVPINTTIHAENISAQLTGGSDTLQCRILTPGSAAGLVISPG